MGGRPSLADFALYGPLYAHLYRDPASGEIMKARAPNVAEWVERLLTGAYAAGELAYHVPETLLPILARHAAEHLPVLEQTNALLGAWAEGKTAGTEVPRALGTAMFNIEGVEGGIIARPFSLFRLQAALDVYAGLTDAERAKASYERKVAKGWRKIFVDPGTQKLGKNLGGIDRIPRHVDALDDPLIGREIQIAIETIDD